MPILANARLLAAPRRPATAEEAAPLVDIRIEQGLISAVTPAAGGAAPGASRIDLGGRSVVPGLWDRHAHLNQWALARRRFDLTGATSPAHAVQLALSALGGFDATSGQPLTGFGFRSGLWSDQPDKHLLDAALGVVPTVLVSWDLHSAWLNSAALALYGLPDDSDGIVREDVCFDLLRRMADVPDATMDAWVGEAIDDAVRRGLVGVVDMEMSWSPGAWRRRAADGVVPVAVEASVYAQDLGRAIEEGLASGASLLPPALLPPDGSRRDSRPTSDVRMGPLKIIADGSLNTRTAYCFAPYGGVGPAGRGVFNMPEPELIDAMRLATDRGIRCAIHAIGDAANAAVIDAFAASGASGSIEHVQLLRAADIRRMAEAGIEASVQPRHAVDDRPVTDGFWADRATDAFRLRSLVDGGVRLRFGSDAPVAELDPWAEIAAAVFRADPGEEPWHGAEALRADEAIAASTESGSSVPVPGDPADLVVLDADPGVAAAAGLAAMPVSGTMRAGAWAWRSFD